MTKYYRKRDSDGLLCIKQGIVHGYPVTYNPDVGRFYVHKINTTNGTNVLATFKDWRNAVQFARNLFKTTQLKPR